MQEILFSAKRIDNGYTVYGYHIKDGVTGKHFIVAEGSMLHESDKVGEEGLLNFVAFEVDEDTISVTDDGWIPVEERMPEKDGYYLVQVSEKLPNEDYSDRVVVLYSEEDKDFMSYSRLIVAWRPLPEPYRPERGDNHDGE